jgi:hypothetical protein
MDITARLLTACAITAATPCFAKPPVLAPVDFSACANNNQVIGNPVGVSTGNALTKDSKLTFTLLDPTTGNNVWVGSAGGQIEIKLSVPSPTAVYLLMNSYYGQSAIANAKVIFKGSNSTHRGTTLIGNTTIRDFNNWVWTNTINGKSAQEWWTNNLNPQPQDQSHRMDTHYFNLSTEFAGQTLTEIIIQSPTNAGVNYMEPALFAIGVAYSGASGTIPSTCKLM